jgi:hypothetical protein
MNAVMEPVSVLDQSRHARLIADIDHICAIARVPRLYVETSMKQHCDAAEVEYVVNFRLYRASVGGLVISEKKNPDTRIMAICGAFVRNFIDARVYSLTDILEAVQDKDVPEPTVMLIPNLYVPSLPKWKSSLLYDVLLRRLTSNLPTVVAVESMMDLRKDYGETFFQHLTSHYKFSK